MTDYRRTVGHITEQQKAACMRKLMKALKLWEPHKGLLCLAAASLADILFYGNSAGGGKTDLIIDKSQTDHFSIVVDFSSG